VVGTATKVADIIRANDTVKQVNPSVGQKEYMKSSSNGIII
jgi:hypothetical protein